MYECQICGLLSLGGTACPACGSQLRTDLALTSTSDEVLPTEVPGLDEAAAAWYELEGIEPVTSSEMDTPPERKQSADKGLPFGFQGASNVYDSRLPFGIGSFAEGIPFDPAQTSHHKVAATTDSVKVQGGAPSNEPSEENPLPVEPDVAPSVPQEMPEEHEPAVMPASVSELPSMPELPSDPEPIEVSVEENAAPLDMDALPPIVEEAPVRLHTARLVQPGSKPVSVSPDEPTDADVPDYWKIDASIPDYEEIYDNTEAVVQMEYGSLNEDVVVYDHETDSPAAVFHSPLEATPAAVVQPSVKLSLHPAQALAIEVGGSTDLQALVNQGFGAMQRSAWSDAARSFQRLAASLPSSPEVFNNYGISLLQRAIGMRDGGDVQQQQLAEPQFESAILALREAAKNAPANGDILVNLACALVESGRAEKALGIMNVHNARTPGSVKGLNTAAVAMFQLGQLTQSVQTLQKISDDSVASQNLARLSPSIGH